MSVVDLEFPSSSCCKVTQSVPGTSLARESFDCSSSLWAHFDPLHCIDGFGFSFSFRVCGASGSTGFSC